MNSVLEKTCSKCGVPKPATAEFFGKYKKAKSGITSWCRACRNADNSARRKINPEQGRGYRRKWREANLERAKAENSAYYKANPEMAREKSKRWREANPEKAKAFAKVSKLNRRAAEANAEGSFTAAEFTAKLKAQKGCCYWCADRITGPVHADHVIPVSKGGNNYITNIVPACPTCNLSKGAKTPWDFAGRLF